MYEYLINTPSFSSFISEVKNLYSDPSLSALFERNFTLGSYSFILKGLREQPSTSDLISYYDKVMESQYISEIMVEVNQTFELNMPLEQLKPEFLKMPKIKEFVDEISYEWSKDHVASELLIDL